MCRALEVTRSAFYRWCRLSEPSNAPLRRSEDERLGKRVREIFEDHDATYGVRRLQNQLRDEGVRVGVNRMSRLMRDNDLFVKTKRKFKATTNSKHSRPVSPNLVCQNFTAPMPNALWTGDITYISTSEGWLYLAVVLDVYSRKIVGWSMNERQTDDLVIEAFRHAMLHRKPESGLIFHSDRGSQYCSRDFRSLLSENGFRQSMSATGNCWDNAVTETFFHTLKTELVYHEHYASREQARSSIFWYIEAYYNRKRKHSTIGYVSPEQFENSADRLVA